MKQVLFLSAVALALAAACTVPAAAAVFVDVETSAGTFTSEMDPAARHGGAAFLGLAEGWIDWVDPRNGQPMHGNRYYDGSAFSLVQKDMVSKTDKISNCPSLTSRMV